jgi:general secretion pathway protein F
MPLYQYQALDMQGRHRKGLIEAHGEREAKEKLREQGLMVKSLGQKSSGGSKGHLKGDNLIAFTVQLSQLVNAGIPLYESLLALEEQYRREAFHRILLSICDQIKAGTSLSQAMGSYPESFNKLYCSMIAAGESSGALGAVLDRLSHLLKKQMKLKRQITTALIYPAILASFSFLIILLLLGFVIPSIEGIFADRPINAFTQLIIHISHLFQNYWWLLFPVVGGLIVFLVFKLRSPEGRIWIERTSLKIPLIKTLVVQTSVARFCRTMGTMQQGGMTMIDSLQIGRAIMRNVVLEEEIRKAEIKIIEGSSMSVEMGRSKWIPQLVPRMLAVGEDSGTMTIMLNKIADIYEEELEKSLDRIMALAQPVILVFMGSIIGMVLMAILLPLTDVSSFMQE